MYFILLSLFLAGCVHNSTNQNKSTSPKIYFDKAVQYNAKKSYVRALEQLRELRKYFFYSSYNQKAVLLTADIYFVQGKYSQAVKSYEKHFQLYPEEKKDYVLYRIGLSYKKQLPYRSDYDLSLSDSALKAFDKLLNLKG